jgi:ubiquinol-cytochrome c reductase cytochrome b subunit
MRDAQGGYTEKHLPLPVERAYELTARDRDEIYEADGTADGNGIPAPTARVDQLRSRLSKAWFRDSVQKPTAAELEAGHHHADEEAAHDAPMIGQSADGHQFDGRHAVDGEDLTHKH